MVNNVNQIIVLLVFMTIILTTCVVIINHKVSIYDVMNAVFCIKLKVRS